MDKKTFAAAFLAVFAAAPAWAGPSACLAECATKHDAVEAECRVKSGSDVVKACLDETNANYESCRQACAKEYKLNDRKSAPSAATQASSTTETPPAQPPAR